MNHEPKHNHGHALDGSSRATAFRALDLHASIDDAGISRRSADSPVIEVVKLSELISGEKAGYLTDPSVLVIACTSDPSVYAGFSSERFLLLDFDDITNPERAYSFKPEHAHRIAGFVKGALEGGTRIGRIIASCDGGKSRSAAVAAALMLWLGQDDEHAIWLNPDPGLDYRPNRLVLEVLCEELGVGMTKGAIDEKYRRSEQNRKVKFVSSRQDKCGQKVPRKLKSRISSRHQPFG